MSRSHTRLLRKANVAREEQRRQDGYAMWGDLFWPEHIEDEHDRYVDERIAAEQEDDDLEMQRAMS